MREKLETLSLAVLRDLAKSLGMTHVSSLRKAELIAAIIAQNGDKYEEEEQKESARQEAYAPEEKEESREPKAEDPAAPQGPERRIRRTPRPDNRRTPRTEGARTENPRPTGRTGRYDYNAAMQKSEQQKNDESQTPVREQPRTESRPAAAEQHKDIDSGLNARGILEIMPDGFGFLRSDNFLPGDADVYVAPSQIHKFRLKTGDVLTGSRRVKAPNEKYAALLFISHLNDIPIDQVENRPNFEDLTPIFPQERIHLEMPGGSLAMRIVDLLSPIGKGQRGMIASQPKAGKTTLLKEIANAVTRNHKDMHVIILLIDERPEEVTDIKESISGSKVEVIHSTFDETPEHHKRVAEMVLERAKRLVEHGQDVMILLDSITRLARAYNMTVAPSGRTLSGGLDPAALHMPKKFFGSARKMREGGSLTILATALVETGSRMDDVVFEEFKGTGNMELMLSRKLSERRIFPAIDILKSGTRREDLLLDEEEQAAAESIHRAISGSKPEESVEHVLDLFKHTRNNQEFCQAAKKTRF